METMEASAIILIFLSLDTITLVTRPFTLLGKYTDRHVYLAAKLGEFCLNNE